MSQDNELPVSEAEMFKDFEDWKAMGEGGTPPTWTGYLSALSTEKTVAFKDTTSNTVYQHPEKYASGWSEASEAQKAAARQSFFREPLPVREGPRSRAKRYVFPQRERDAADPRDPAIDEAYSTRFSELGDTNSEATEWKTSALEKRGLALFLKSSQSLSSLCGPSQREICHIHESDMSGHITLSFADAQEVIEKGWGERHRLSGTKWIHLGYTMVYVPRTIEEIEVLAKIFQAGIDYMKAE